MPTTHPAVLAVVHTKGGAGKTTTVAHVASALHERGLRVLAVDADPQQSLWRWHEAAPFPFRVGIMPTKRLHLEVGGVGGRPDVIVLDTPGTEHGLPIVLSALIAATHVLIPVAPTGIEVAEMAHVRAVFDDATTLRPDGQPPPLGVLLVKVRPAASATAYREQLAASGWRVLRPHVALLERFGQSWGEPVVDASRSGYADAAAELLGLARESRHARPAATA